MGTTGSAAPTFNGTSTYAAQLQAVIDRATTAASGPLDALQTQQTTLNNQQSELQTLTTDFQSLQTALDSINTAAGTGSYTANVDTTSVASASVSSGAMAGTYALNVVSLGSRTNTMSNAGSTAVTNPSTGNIDSSSSYTLTVDGKTYSVTDSSNSLNGLAQAINQSGANVQATVVNVGSSSSPDYRLSVQSLNYAPDTIQLSDGTNNSLLNTVTTGSYYTYQVNGQPSTPINSSSNTVMLSNGLSVTLKAVGTANVTVSQSTNGISNALSSFVTAYNNVVDELAKNRGQNGGALSGQSTVLELQSALQNLAQYAGQSGSISSLADLGLTFDDNGHLQFDSSVFSSAAATSSTDVMNFLGSESSGGFLQAASNILNSVTDSTTGILPTTTSNITQELSTIATQISNDQTNVTNLQTSLTTQMNAADATISSLQTQVSEMTMLFSDMQTEQDTYNHD